jgi:hypothetical protein
VVLRGGRDRPDVPERLRAATSVGVRNSAVLELLRIHRQQSNRCTDVGLVASSVLMSRMAQAYLRRWERFIEEEGIELVQFRILLDARPAPPASKPALGQRAHLCFGPFFFAATSARSTVLRCTGTANSF